MHAATCIHVYAADTQLMTSSRPALLMVPATVIGPDGLPRRASSDAVSSALPNRKAVAATCRRSAWHYARGCARTHGGNKRVKQTHAPGLLVVLLKMAQTCSGRRCRCRLVPAAAAAGRRRLLLIIMRGTAGAA